MNISKNSKRKMVQRCALGLVWIFAFWAKLLPGKCDVRIQRIHNFEFTLASIHSEFSFLRFYTTSKYQCAQLCICHNACKSINYFLLDNFCVLYYVEHVDSIAIDRDSHYSKRDDLPKEIAGKCAKHDCDRYTMCMEEDGTTICVATMPEIICYLPVPEANQLPYLNATFSATAVTMGEKVEYKCNFPLAGIVEFICSPSTAWIRLFKSCSPDFCDGLHEIYGNYTSGTYNISTHDDKIDGKTVYCDSDTDSGDWMVIQVRDITSCDYHTSGQLYNEGFGAVEEMTSYWFGNFDLFLITNYTEVELRIEFNVLDDPTLYFAKYGTFFVREEDYNITVGDYLGGNCGDGMSCLDGLPFTVFDDDRGGWWQAENHTCTNLNAARDGGNLKWTYTGFNSTHLTNITSTKMMIRRKNK